MNRTWIGIASAALMAVAVAFAPTDVEAFCGTYVSGGDAELFNNATQVVMMRHEQTTVLSMQNNYEGPEEDFAMIVPTPVVLQKENVKTLEDEIFETVDTLTAPRLVEYWEKDPCETNQYYDDGAKAAGSTETDSANRDVEVEAEFDVGEYNVVVLSSTESTALETWLHDNGFNIPDGAAPYLEPYIQQGSKFFVAKVDTESKHLTYEDGEAVLSPLRFHYESDQFKLPIRLGLINSKGKQDLIVNILAQNQRYKVANYSNATIPTNIEVVDAVRNRFASFYRALFRETLRQNTRDGQKPVVTEYSWNASSCDPCPGPVGGLSGSDLATLGADVVREKQDSDDSTRSVGYRGGWVVTRLHARYGKDEVGKDLVFEKADPIVGGRERYDEDGNLERGAQPGQINNFQGRYIIRHRWDEAVLCDDPQYERWGRRSPEGDISSVGTAKGPNNGGAEVNADSSEEDGDLSNDVREDIPELGVEADNHSGRNAERACAQMPFGDGSTLPWSLVVLFGALGWFRWRRR